MPIRTLLLAAGASLAMATPALAQVDDRYADVAVETGDWDGTFVDIGGATIYGDFGGTWIGEDRFVTDEGRMLYLDDEGMWREDAMGEGEYRVERRVIRRDLPRREVAAHSGPVLGYTAEERAAWIAQCVSLHDRSAYELYSDPYYRHRDNDGNGGLIGGLLGAVVGGFAGNRIDDDGNRLAGTLIGAGIGGVAGAVIGAAIDRDDERYDDYGYYDDEVYYDNAAYYANYCNAYLTNYERGYGVPGQVQAVPVTMVATPARTARRALPRELHIEVIEQEIAAERPTYRAEPAPVSRRTAPRPVKTQPIK